MGLAAIRQYSLPEFTRASTFLLDILSFSRFLHLSSVEMPLEAFAMGNELNAEIIISSLGDYGFFSVGKMFSSFLLFKNVIISKRVTWKQVILQM